MKIENAKYCKEMIRPDGSSEVVGINCTIDGRPYFVLINDDERTYQEIKRQKDAGTISIAAAE